MTAWRVATPGRPRKTPVATAFQIVELLKLVKEAKLPVFSEEATEKLRQQSVARISAALDEVLVALPEAARTPALKAYLESVNGAPHATA
jgi:hypothetical protein